MYTRSCTHRHKSYDYTIHPVFDERAVPTPRCVSIRIDFIFHSHSTRHTSTPTPIRRRDARERIQTTHAYRPVTTNDGIRGRARAHSFHFVRVKFKKRVRAASEEEGGPPVDFEFKIEVRTSARARARAFGRGRNGGWCPSSVVVEWSVVEAIDGCERAFVWMHSESERNVAFGGRI